MDIETLALARSYANKKVGEIGKPMVFKGTLGIDGTVSDLPTASTSNEGYSYQVITPGTYAGQSAVIGDLFVSNGTNWVLIPSGDEIYEVVDYTITYEDNTTVTIHNIEAGD